MRRITIKHELSIRIRPSMDSAITVRYEVRFLV